MKYLKIAFVAVAALLGSCHNPESEPVEPLLDVTPSNIAGVWMLESYDGGATLAEGSYVYLDIVRSDRTYTLYQNVGSMGVEVKTGRYYIENDPELGAVIRGTYGTSEYDYDEWSHRYIVELTAKQMRWTAKDDRADVSVYRRVEALPEF